MATLVIKDLFVKVKDLDVEILKGVNLTISDQETVALLGPNGHGKSTLLSAIMGHPKYEVTSGEITLDGKNVLEMEVDERSKAGLFLGMQHPSEVPGVINSDFLKAAMNVRREKPITLVELYRQLEQASKQMKIPMELTHRHLNEGFSGGERKRNEILQLLLLQGVKVAVARMEYIGAPQAVFLFHFGDGCEHFTQAFSGNRPIHTKVIRGDAPDCREGCLASCPKEQTFRFVLRGTYLPYASVS